MRDWLGQTGVTEIDEPRFQPRLFTTDAAGDLQKAKHHAG